MIDGNVNEFVDHIYYGDELWFLYDGKKYFLEGWPRDGKLCLCLYEMTEDGKEFVWEGSGSHYPVEEFLKAKIWNGKSFWAAEQEMQWIDS